MARLDVDGERKSTVDFLLQALTKALADDAGYLERAAATIRQGGTMVMISPINDLKTAERATEVLKSFGGSDVQHWGEWTTEQL